MSKTSWEVKEKYNKKTYGRITASIDKNLVEEFKKQCAADGVSIASVLKKAIEDYLENKNKNLQ